MWHELSEWFGIGARAAARVHDELRQVLPQLLAIVADSPLPSEQRRTYAELLDARVPPRLRTG